MKQILQQLFMKQRLSKVESELRKMIADDNKFIERELMNIYESGGKRLRPALLLMVANYYKNNCAEIYNVAGIMELIHMASLIHDDINDAADIRRGTKTLNNKFGDEVAVHFGDFLLMKALGSTRNLTNEDLVLKCISELAIEMSKGEIAQIKALFDINQTMASYYYRIERKTAILIAACCKLGAELSNATEIEAQAFYEYGYHLGIAFQIKDDIFDLQADENAMLGKPVGTDLYQGHINLPTILVLQEDFLDKQILLNLIQSKFKNKDDLKIATKIIIENSGIQKSETIMKEHIKNAKSALSILKTSNELAYFHDGADYILQRKV